MRGISGETKELIRYACHLLEGDHPQTLRQLHYAIFSRKEIAYKNTQADYKRLSRATSLARRTYRAWALERALISECPSQIAVRKAAEYAEIAEAHNFGDDLAQLFRPPDDAIPSDWMVNETRQPEMVNVWRDARAYVDTVKRSYRRDNWQDQRNYCEVWSEKATILGAIRPVADQWGITLRVCHGFGSTGMAEQVGRHFEGLARPITVFFLGDHDPSGHVIEQDIHHRVQTASGVDFRMLRLAIHPRDIAAFKLPPQTVKVTDSRATSFRRRFGVDAPTVELDALPASELRRRVETNVRDLVDITLWERQVSLQDLELNCIAEIADRMKALPQLGHTRGDCGSEG